MAQVGIIANPASGKDIRRLIAHGSVFDNQEKVNIVRRIMLGVKAAGVEGIIFMPDYFGICQRAVDGADVDIPHATLDMPLHANQDDSTRAAKMMREMGVGAVVTLGGDGTNRAVAKEIGDVPIIPISTGTNNVFPKMIEGTIAGLAAGIVAERKVPLEVATERQLRLDIRRDGETFDIALVDVVANEESFIGAKAIYDMTRVREIILTQASASNIGLSSVGGGLFCKKYDRQHGIYILLGEGSGTFDLTAPVAPGMIETVHISGYKLIEIGEDIQLRTIPSILALDGEREVIVNPEDSVKIRLTDKGPLVIDYRKTMKAAAEAGVMTQINAPLDTERDCILHGLGLCLEPCGEGE